MIYDIKITKKQIKLIMNALYLVENEFGNADDEMEIYNYLEETTGVEMY